jgi:hypothetical protein
MKQYTTIVPPLHNSYCKNLHVNSSPNDSNSDDTRYDYDNINPEAMCNPLFCNRKVTH